MKREYIYRANIYRKIYKFLIYKKKKKDIQYLSIIKEKRYNFL